MKRTLATMPLLFAGSLPAFGLGGVANGPDGHWAFSVNGIRSPYHIDTQLAEGVRTIRFRYVTD
jgi:hypothetical protein